MRTQAFFLSAFTSMVGVFAVCCPLTARADSASSVVVLQKTVTGEADAGFGSALAVLGDLDADGNDEIAIGADTTSDGAQVAGAVWIGSLTGSTVTLEQKISATSGGFTAPLGMSHRFGTGLAGIGDLDGDGVPDLAVGASGHYDAGTAQFGALYILFLNPDGTVKSHTRITRGESGFMGAYTYYFGHAVASLGDLDGDSVTDIAVSAYEAPNIYNGEGEVWILFLNDDGTVKGAQKISNDVGGFSGHLVSDDNFGFSLTSLGDVDGDSLTDLAVGAVQRGLRGSVFILRLNADGTVKSDDEIAGVDLTPALPPKFSSWAFGAALSYGADFDDDGTADLAYGGPHLDPANSRSGAAGLLMLDANEAVTSSLWFGAGTPGLTEPLAPSDFFGASVLVLDDANGNGRPELLVGTPGDDGGMDYDGAVWTLELYICGDGIVDAGEQCDDDGESAVCDVDCTFPACGDGVLNVSAGEECDDGNTTNGDCCGSTCSLEPAGSPCVDATVCNGDESCDGAGTCTAGTPLDCRDGDPCTYDTCDPVLGCQSDDAPSCAAQPGVDGRLKISINSAGETELKWTRKYGYFSPYSAPDDKPSALCIWDTHGGSYERVFEASLPAEPASWTFKSGILYYSFAAFHDDLGLHDGFTKIVSVRRGFHGRLKFSLLLQGPNAPAVPAFPPERMFDQSPTVYVQYSDDQGLCLGSYFEVENTSKNLTTKFSAKRR